MPDQAATIKAPPAHESALQPMPYHEAMVAYLKTYEADLWQADEIFQLDNPQTSEASHPEGFMRARSLRLWREQGAAATAEITRMIAGTLELERLDLLGKMNVATVTRRVIDALLH